MVAAAAAVSVVEANLKENAMVSSRKTDDACTVCSPIAYVMSDTCH